MTRGVSAVLVTNGGECDIEQDNDVQELLPDDETEDNRFFRMVAHTRFLTEKYKYIIIIDVFSVFILTMLFTKMNSYECGLSSSEDVEDVVEWCEPFQPVNQIKVDFYLENKLKYYTAKLCVAYAEVLTKQQGINYNFVYCPFHKLFVLNGFQCRSDELRISMPKYTMNTVGYPGRYWVIRTLRGVLSKIVFEGVRCGKIHRDYNITINCSKVKSDCETEIKITDIDLYPFWDEPSLKEYWFEPPHLQGYPFQAFVDSRVFDISQKTIRVCNESSYYDSLSISDLVG